MSKVIEKFLNYVKIDTQSDENSTACPTTAKQHNLAKLLVKDTGIWRKPLPMWMQMN